MQVRGTFPIPTSKPMRDYPHLFARRSTMANVESLNTLNDSGSALQAACTKSLCIDGRERSVIVYAPPGLPVGSPMLVMFHGGGGRASRFRRQVGPEFEALARELGFAVAYPQGIGGYWNSCQRGRKTAATVQDVDDVGFAQAIIEREATDLHIDPTRVFAAGYSNGGHLCFRLALERRPAFAAFATIAANRPAPADCKCQVGNKPANLIMINGRRDPINPFGGGRLSPYGLKYLGLVMSSLDSAASYAPPDAMYKLSPISDAKDVVAVRLHSWGTTVRLIEVIDGGHTVPQSRYQFPFLFGRTSRKLDAATEIFFFFKGFL